MVGISPRFFCRRQNWLVYQPDLSVVDNTGCYINRFCLSWTILVGKSPCFVCCEQYWLLYIPGLCAMNKTGWYITRFCPLWTIMVGISPRFFCCGQKLVGISIGFVCRRQK